MAKSTIEDTATSLHLDRNDGQFFKAMEWRWCLCSAATSDAKLEDHEVSGAAPPFSIIGGGWRVVTADPCLRVSGFMELVRGFKAQYGGAQRWRRRVVLRKEMKRRK